MHFKAENGHTEADFGCAGKYFIKVQCERNTWQYK